MALAVNHWLRQIDFVSYQRPDYIIANSIEVKNRIRKFYRREAEVIYPPASLCSPEDAASLRAGEALRAGKKYKSYRGMGSVSAMKEGSAARYGQEYRQGQEKKLVAEGVEGLVHYKGTVEEVVTQLIGGLRSGMYYAGVKNIVELQEKTRLIRVTQASLLESHPHDIIQKTDNR